MLNARSPKYTALYDVRSGVRFRHGRAEVTDEQARLLAKRRFVDGILIEEIPAKKWLQQQDQSDTGESGDEPDTTQDAPPVPGENIPEPDADAVPTITTEPAVEQKRAARKAT